MHDIDIRQRRKEQDRSELLSGFDDYSDHKSSPMQPNKGTRKLCRKLCVIFTISNVLFWSLLMLVYVFVPTDIDPQPFDLVPPPKLEGPLAPNLMLSKTERIMEGEILGPESIYVDTQGRLYTGTWDGRVVQIDKRKVINEVLLGVQPCDASYASEPDCGRPLGIRMNAANQLIVADAYLGIYSVDIWQGTKEQLVAGGTPVEGRPMRFINDFALLDDGTIIFTDSSSKWDRRRFMKIVFEMKPDGRLLSYNPTTKKVTLLMDNLYFPNGVELSLDKQSVYVAETCLARVLRFFVAGPRKGELEGFVNNLPGLPDNIRLAANGSLWIPMASVRHAGAFSAHDFMSKRPYLRALITKLMPFSLLTYVAKKISPAYRMIVLVSAEGKVISSLHDPTGRVGDVSQITDVGNVLFLGSYQNHFIGRLDLENL